MKLCAGLLLGLCLLAGPALGQTTTPPATATCSVSRDPELLIPVNQSLALWHVLDRSASAIRRWVLPAGAPKSSFALGANAIAFAYLSHRQQLVIAHGGDTPHLSFRGQADGAPEQTFFTLSEDDGEICGLGATETRVVLCLNHNQWAVFDEFGHRLDDPVVPTLVGDADDTGHSWDAMVWDPDAQTMFALRTQGTAAEGIAAAIDDDGAVDADVEDFESDATLEDAMLTPSPDGGFITPAGVTFDPDTLEVEFPDPNAPKVEPFVVGNELFGVSSPTDPNDPNFPQGECALDPGSLATVSPPLMHSGLVRATTWQDKTFFLHGEPSSAKPYQLRVDTEDVDGDLSPNDADFFPLDRADARKDADHDGVENSADKVKFDARDWLDADGDGAGDDHDAFPNDPKETEDSDGDHVGDNADCNPNDPALKLNSDSDPLCDEVDAYPLDPLGQTPGQIGPIGAAGTPTEVFNIDLKRGARLFSFKNTSATDQFATLTLFDSDQFELCLAFPCVSASPRLSGTATPKGSSGKKWVLTLDVPSRSGLETQFATVAADIVLHDPADPPSPALTFVPKSVTSDGTLKRTKSGVSLLLNVRFAFQRPERLARGSRGMFVFRAKGTPAP